MAKVMILSLYSYALLTAFLLHFVCGERQQEVSQWDRELVSLKEKWNLTENGFSYDQLSFSLAYITSDFVLDSMMAAQLYTVDCKEGGVTIPSSELNATLVPDDTEPGEGEVDRDVSVVIDLNPSTISNSATYNEATTSEGAMVATVVFCMRFALYTNGNSPIEVNFLETIVTLTIDLTDGFTIDTLNVAPRDALVRTANQAYQVEGFQCNELNEPLSASDGSPARSQGDIIRVCVRPDKAARDDQVFMRYIDSFDFQRDYGGQIGIVSQPAIVDRMPAANLLTDMYCISGSMVCAFETILTAAMYRTPGSVTGTGVASMQFGEEDLSRRQLQQTSRVAQEDDDIVAGVAEFELDFELVPVYNPFLQGRNPYSSASTFLAYRILNEISIPLLLLLWQFCFG